MIAHGNTGAHNSDTNENLEIPVQKNAHCDTGPHESNVQTKAHANSGKKECTWQQRY